MHERQAGTGREEFSGVWEMHLIHKTGISVRLKNEGRFQHPTIKPIIPDHETIPYFLMEPDPGRMLSLIHI